MAKKLSVATEQALSVIAHVSMADSIEKGVTGMAGFSAFYAEVTGLGRNRSNDEPRTYAGQGPVD
jgi:hypothetical protein